jgi:hypothetical protein
MSMFEYICSSLFLTIVVCNIFDICCKKITSVNNRIDGIHERLDCLHNFLNQARYDDNVNLKANILDLKKLIDGK